MPAGNSAGRKIRARSAASLSGTTAVISMTPISTILRVSGHAIEASSILSSSSGTSMRKLNRTGAPPADESHRQGSRGGFRNLLRRHKLLARLGLDAVATETDLALCIDALETVDAVHVDLDLSYSLERLFFKTVYVQSSARYLWWRCLTESA